MNLHRKILTILALAMIGCNQPPMRLDSKLSHFDRGWITRTGMEAIPVSSTIPIHASDMQELADLVLQPKSDIPFCHPKYRVEFEKFHEVSEKAINEALELEYCWNGNARVMIQDTANNREFYEIEATATNRVLAQYFEDNDGKCPPSQSLCKWP